LAILEASWSALALFVALTLSLALYGLTASGHFPAEHRGESLRGGLGSVILWGTMAMSGIAAVYGIAFAMRTLPWHLAVIGAGAALLVAPLLLQPLPDRFVDGRRGLLAFSALAIILMAVAGLTSG
jgi:hypothetical protein